MYDDADAREREQHVQVAALWILLALVLWPTAASAHALGVSRSELAIVGSELTLTLVFRQDELGESPDDVVREAPIDADGKACAALRVSSSFDAPDGIRIVGRYECGRPPAHLHLHAGFLARLPSGHAHVLVVAGSEHLLVLAHPDVDVDLGAPAAPTFVGFVREGIKHILTGADHLLFLLGLVLLPRDAEQGPSSRRIRAVILVLTAFTVGHSVSLAIATLGGVAPSARLVEPLVALSVAYVGGENLVAKNDPLRRRWMLTLPFGLIHGFAFASGLLIVGLPRSKLPAALVGFNGGVELGQLAVMALVLPWLFVLAKRWPSIYDRARQVASLVVLGLGLVWFVERVI